MPHNLLSKCEENLKDFKKMHNSIPMAAEIYDDFVESFVEIVEEAKTSGIWNALLPLQQDIFSQDAQEQKTFAEAFTAMVYEFTVDALKSGGTFDWSDERAFLDKEEIDTVISTTFAKWDSVGIHLSKHIKDSHMLMFFDMGYIKTIDYITHINDYENNVLQKPDGSTTDCMIQAVINRMDYTFFRLLEHNDFPSDREYQLNGDFATAGSTSVPAKEAFVLFHPLITDKNILPKYATSELSCHYSNMKTEGESVFRDTIETLNPVYLKETELRTAAMKYYVEKISKKAGEPVDFITENSRFKIGNKTYDMSAGALTTLLVSGGYSVSKPCIGGYGRGRKWDHFNESALLTISELDGRMVDVAANYYFFPTYRSSEELACIQGIIHDVLSEAYKKSECSLGEDETFYNAVQNFNKQRAMERLVVEGDGNDSSAPANHPNRMRF